MISPLLLYFWSFRDFLVLLLEKMPYLNTRYVSIQAFSWSEEVKDVKIVFVFEPSPQPKRNMANTDQWIMRTIWNESPWSHVMEPLLDIPTSAQTLGAPGHHQKSPRWPREYYTCDQLTIHTIILNHLGSWGVSWKWIFICCISSDPVRPRSKENWNEITCRISYDNEFMPWQL